MKVSNWSPWDAVMNKGAFSLSPALFVLIQVRMSFDLYSTTMHITGIIENGLAATSNFGAGSAHCSTVSACSTQRQLSSGLCQGPSTVLSSVAGSLSLFRKMQLFSPECATYFATISFNHHNLNLRKINANDTLEHVLQFLIDLNINYLLAVNL